MPDPDEDPSAAEGSRARAVGPARAGGDREPSAPPAGAPAAGSGADGASPSDTASPAAPVSPWVPDAARARLVALLAALEGAERLFVVTHDNPDPDALASAAALAFLLRELEGMSPTVLFGGIVGRAENRQLLQELDVEFVRMEETEIPTGIALAMVDTQPRAGNNSLPAGRIVSAVIDHHPPRPDSAATTFADLRPEFGASGSMLVEYLRAADLEPEPWLATALFYAIQTETMDLGREASAHDVEASMFLYPRSDPAGVSRIKHARVPASYFRTMHEAVAVARKHGRVVAIPLGLLAYPDMVAEIADEFLQMQGVDWTVALGRYRDRLLISVRAHDTTAHAGTRVREAIGERGSAGGHGTFAGGQIDLRGKSETEIEALRRDVLGDLLRALDADPDVSEALIPEPEA